jgi:hypothetical protein
MSVLGIGGTGKTRLVGALWRTGSRISRRRLVLRSGAAHVVLTEL